MPDDYKISDLTTAGAITNSDLVEVSTVNPSSPSGYSSVKATMTQLGNKLANDLQYSADLQTTAKTLVGAINEVASGSSIDMPVKSATGNPCTFDTDLADNLVSLTAEIVASGGNGTPDNPIPIVGYTGGNIFNVNSATAQLWTIDSNFNGKIYYNQLATNENKSKSITPDNTQTYSTYSFSLNPTIVANHKYYVCCDITYSGSKTLRSFCMFGTTYGKPAQDISNGTTRCSWVSSSVTGVFTLGLSNINTSDKLTSSDSWSWDNLIIFDLTAMFGSTIADYIFNMSGSLGVDLLGAIFTDSYYSPSTGNEQFIATPTASIDWTSEGTVYGGVLDVTRGKLHVTWGSVDLGTQTWTYNSSNSWRSPISDSIRQTNPNTKPNWICSHYHISTQNNPTFPSLSGLDWFTGVCFWSTDYTTAEQVKMAMNGVEMIYELATPFDIDLTPVQISALVGTNNITSDLGGDVEVDYASGELAQGISKMIEANPTWKEITGTLTAGNTSITLSDASITTESTIDVYTDTFGVNPTAVSVSAGAVTLTFAAQSSNVKVKVRIT